MSFPLMLLCRADGRQPALMRGERNFQALQIDLSLPATGEYCVQVNAISCYKIP